MLFQQPRLASALLRNYTNMQFIYYNPFEYFLLISIKAKVSLIPTHPSPSIKPILVDTFIELLDEKVTKLRDINIITKHFLTNIAIE